MKNDYRAIQFSGTKATMEKNDLHFVSYVLEKYLLEYLTLKVIALNSRHNNSWQENKPLTIIIGDKNTLDTFMKVVEAEQQFDCCGDVAYFRHITCDELAEFVYEKQLHSNSPLVTIYGFEKVTFSPEPENEMRDLSLLLSDLSKIQNQFKVPILLSGLTKIVNGDNSESLLPNFDSKWGEVELATDACWNIEGPIGHIKLFRLDKNYLGVWRHHERKK